MIIHYRLWYRSWSSLPGVDVIIKSPLSRVWKWKDLTFYTNDWSNFPTLGQNFKSKFCPNARHGLSLLKVTCWNMLTIYACKRLGEENQNSYHDNIVRCNLLTNWILGCGLEKGGPFWYNLSYSVSFITMAQFKAWKHITYNMQ